jgi:hypothetical protein
VNGEYTIIQEDAEALISPQVIESNENGAIDECEDPELC